MEVYEKCFSFVIKGPCAMKITSDISRGKALGPSAAMDMLWNYRLTVVWDAKHPKALVGMDGKNSEGKTMAWEHCSVDTLTEKEKSYEVDDSARIKAVASMSMATHLSPQEWIFKVKVHGEPRHYVTTGSPIEDWKKHAKELSGRKKAETACFWRVRYTYPEWGLKKLKENKQVMYVGNIQVHHRNWNGPSLIQIVGTKGTTHPVRIEDVGEIKLFCVTDNNGTRSDHAWVIPDREVLVRYTEASTRVMVPAFLLCMNSSDDWLHML